MSIDLYDVITLTPEGKVRKALPGDVILGYVANISSTYNIGEKVVKTVTVSMGGGSSQSLEYFILFEEADEPPVKKLDRFTMLRKFDATKG